MTVPMDQPWEKWNSHRPRLKLDQSDTKDSARVGISEDYNHEGTVGSVRAEHDGRAWLPRDIRAQDFDNERPQMIKGSPPSLPASRLTRSPTGASGRRRHLFRTPEPGERPLSDAMVLPERLRREGSTARREAHATESGGGRRGGGEARNSPARDGVVSNSEFESDVRRAMNDLERQLAGGDSVGIGERGRRWSEGTDARDTRRVPAMSSLDANPASRDSPHVLIGERAGPFSIETNRKRSGSDVANVYNNVGQASGTRSTTDAGGGTIPSPADLPSQDSEFEKMTIRDETVLGPVRSQRNGPGLRNLWSGPDTAAEVRAKNSAKAAYFRALEQDAQLRRAIASDDNETGRETHRVSRGPSSPSQRSIGSDPADARRVESVATALDSGRKTPRQRAPWEGGEEMDRMNEKAKRAAYAEELRRQIAEKEARKVKEEGRHVGIRRRLSAGRLESASVEGPAQGSIENDRRNRFIERSSSLSGVAGGGLVLTSQHGEYSGQAVPEVHHDRHDDSVGPLEDSMTNGQLHSVSATSARDPIPVERPSSTTARRRLVEDVYGRARVSAALGNAEQRLGSPEGREDRGACVIRGNRVGDGNGDGNSVFVGAARSFLRTGAGMQSLNQSEPEDRLQRRAAALEQQRALKEQIAEKTKLKVEEEARRKLEEEEEARQQREYLRRVEAEAEEEKRRRQAKQQEQLEALYRQQEEALQKKRGGSMDSGGVRRSSDSGTPRNRSRQVMDRGFDAGQNKSPGSERAGQGSPAADEMTLGNDPVALRTPPNQPGGIKLDINDLPAGAHARAEVLRGVPSRGKRESPPWENSEPREHHVDKDLESDERGIEAPPALARGISKEEDRVVHASTGRGVVSRESRRRGSALLVSESRCHRRSDRDANEMPSRQETVGILPSQDVEPPLRNHSTLLPISNATLFPSDPVEAPRLAAGSHGASGGYIPRRRRSIHVVDRPVAVKGRAGSSIGAPEWSRKTAEGSGSGDEIDALVASWNTNPLRGRAVQSPLSRVRGNVDGSRAAESCAGSPKLTISSSPQPRASPRDSRAREQNRSSDGNGVSQEEMLGEFMGSTSRQMGIRMPPIQSAVIPGSKRHPRRGMTSAMEDGPDASEQSLTSDSVLYYLADSHREKTSEPSTSVTAGGSLLVADKAERTRRRRRWGRDCVTAPPVVVPPLRSPLAEAEEEEDRGGDGHEATSPLTRLLAQIDVRLGDCKLGTPSKDLEPVASSGDLRRWSKRAPSEPMEDTCMMPPASGLDGAFSASSSKIHPGGVGGRNVHASPRVLEASRSSDTQLTSSHASRRDPVHGLGRRLSGRIEPRDLEVLKTSSGTERSGSGSSSSSSSGGGGGGGCLAGSRNSRGSWESRAGSDAKAYALSGRGGGVQSRGNE